MFPDLREGSPSLHRGNKGPGSSLCFPEQAGSPELCCVWLAGPGKPEEGTVGSPL